MPWDIDQGRDVHGLIEEGKGKLVGDGVIVGGGDINRDEDACLRGGGY